MDLTLADKGRRWIPLWGSAGHWRGMQFSLCGLGCHSAQKLQRPLSHWSPWKEGLPSLTDVSRCGGTLAVIHSLPLGLACQQRGTLPSALEWGVACGSGTWQWQLAHRMLKTAAKSASGRTCKATGISAPAAPWSLQLHNLTAPLPDSPASHTGASQLLGQENFITHLSAVMDDPFRPYQEINPVIPVDCKTRVNTSYTQALIILPLMFAFI